MSTFLSEHFTLEELTASQTARRLGLDNTPPQDVLENLTYTANKMEKVRDLLNGHPIIISSGYRSPAVNKAVGSKSKKSQHLTGQAVDFTCPKFGSPRKIVEAIKNSDINYDQIIYEFDEWVHISFTQSDNRKQALTIDSQGTRLFA